ncbi:hypothetical protein EIP91_003340 [Steccherinum ochraceum]|uniref:Uncharacterized protein n=1 Tax=Steccherinum ochraceum TaxID=92696 RepID=A0A4R0RJ71_9APHY|nr:hypothetical protein EIP91_003340 [Steccherinum ochraceum]
MLCMRIEEVSAIGADKQDRLLVLATGAQISPSWNSAGTYVYDLSPSWAIPLLLLTLTTPHQPHRKEQLQYRTAPTEDAVMPHKPSTISPDIVAGRVTMETLPGCGVHVTIELACARFSAPPAVALATFQAEAGALYLAGFAQAGDPHAAIILATDSSRGQIYHITTKLGYWAYSSSNQNILGSMSLTSLIKIRDASGGAISPNGLDALLRQVPVPAGAASGECLNWVINAVMLLHQHRVVRLSSAEYLRQEFSQYVPQNRSRATRGSYPGVKVSAYCSA